MSLRKESIAKLKQAVKDKSMGCYNEDVESCVYYHGATQTSCAVGVIVPDKVLNKMSDINGDCGRFHSNYKRDAVKDQLEGYKTYRGVKLEELNELQGIHDRIVLGDIDRKLGIKELEDYINKLV